MLRRTALAWMAVTVLSVVGSACTTYTSTATSVSSGITRPDVTEPTGVLFAELQQEREDVALNLFQVELHNGTDAEVDIATAALSWDGFTAAPPNTGGTKIARKAIVDLPIAFAGARCSGDGTAASMPSIETATVSITFVDATKQTIPVVDTNGMLSRLYLSDCERQNVAKMVKISIGDFHDVTVDGLPRAEATIHFERAASTGTIRLLDIKGSVIFLLVPSGTPASPMLTLSPKQVSGDLPVLVREAKCEDHAFAETKQPFLFVVSVDTGDGIPHGYNVVPDVSVQPHLFNTAIAACHLKNASPDSFPSN